MLYFILNDDGTVTPTGESDDVRSLKPGQYTYRAEFDTLEDAQAIADKLDESFIAVDGGRGCWPRYDVIQRPVVGDDVSYAFNGDYYPCGKVVSVSKTLKVITTRDDKGEVNKFYRRKQTGWWVMNKTWTLVKGHTNRTNRHF